MDQNLSILTERQRQVYLLRQQNLTFVQIGAQLGTSASSASKTYRTAYRRLRDAAILLDAPSLTDARPVDFPSPAANWKRSRAPCPCSIVKYAAKRAFPPPRPTRSHPGSLRSALSCTASGRRLRREKAPCRRAKAWNNRLFFVLSRKKPCLSSAFMIQYIPVKMLI